MFDQISQRVYPQKSLPSRYFDFTFEICKGLFFHFLGSLGVDIHGGFDISVSHDFLDCFDIFLDFAIPGAECVTEIMGREVADQNGIAAISICLNGFVFDIGSTNAVNGAVDTVRGERIAIPILKDKSRIAVYNGLVKAYASPASHLVMNSSSLKIWCNI